MTQSNLSVRAFDRALAVPCTIADLEGVGDIDRTLPAGLDGEFAEPTPPIEYRPTP